MRVVLGLVVAYGALRFVAEGWVERLLGAPFRFAFYGFDWVPALDPAAGYVLYGVIAASAVCVALGYRFRLAAPVCLLAFALAELQDATHYLNHYYLVVLLLGLLCVTPAHAAYSLDARAGRVRRLRRVPAWCIHVFALQLAIVYVYAGLAKVNPDWLARAMPLAVWLPEHAHWPLAGPVFAAPVAAYVFSWLGCLYDLTIVAWLLWRPTRPWAYAAVVGFHALTGLLFNIGLFPLVMIGGTLVFFPAAHHEAAWRRLRGAWSAVAKTGHTSTAVSGFAPRPARRTTLAALAAYLLVQIVLPARALAYPGWTAWSEEGYRFGWRVMLVEKSGQAEFTVVDAATGRRALVDNAAYLTAYQEKQMAIQPDFIAQFAAYLAEVYAREHGFAQPQVYVDSHVSLNARRSAPLVAADVDLAAVAGDWTPKPWIQTLPQ